MEVDRLDLFAFAILRAVLADKTKYLALAQLAAAANEDPRDYIAKWVWSEAKKIESHRP